MWIINNVYKYVKFQYLPFPYLISVDLGWVCMFFWYFINQIDLCGWVCDRFPVGRMYYFNFFSFGSCNEIKRGVEFRQTTRALETEYLGIEYPPTFRRIIEALPVDWRTPQFSVFASSCFLFPGRIYENINKEYFNLPFGNRTYNCRCYKHTQMASVI